MPTSDNTAYLYINSYTDAQRTNSPSKSHFAICGSCGSVIEPELYRDLKFKASTHRKYCKNSKIHYYRYIIPKNK